MHTLIRKSPRGAILCENLYLRNGWSRHMTPMSFQYFDNHRNRRSPRIRICEEPTLNSAAVKMYWRRQNDFMVMYERGRNAKSVNKYFCCFVHYFSMSLKNGLRNNVISVKQQQTMKNHNSENI